MHQIKAATDRLAPCGPGPRAGGHPVPPRRHPGGTPESGDLFGSALSAWDFSRSTARDLAVGVLGQDVNGIADGGAVRVAYGTSAGISSVGVQLWHQDVAGIVNAVETDDLSGGSSTRR